MITHDDDETPGDQPSAVPETVLPADAHLAALHEITLDLMNRRDVRDLLDTILARAAALAGTDHGYIFVSDDEQHLRVESVIGTFEGLRGGRVAMGVGLAGTAWQTGAPITVGDYDAWEGRDPRYPKGVMGSGLCVPLASADGGVIGVIGLAFTASGRSFGDDDVERLTGFARLASIALENARLHESARCEVAERTRTEEALRQTEESYRRLVELSPDGIVVHVDNRFVFANARAAAMLGVEDPEHLLGLPVMDHVHPDHREPVLERRRFMLREGYSVPFVERQFLRADGSAFDVEVAASPLIYRGQEAIQAVFRDISERKASQRARQEAEERYRILIEQLPVVTYRSALDGVTTLYISPQIEDLVGYPASYWISEPAAWEGLLHPEDREAVVTENDRTTETGEGFVMDYRFVARDGSIVWVHDDALLVADGDGRPCFWQGVMVDITERKAAQQALEEAEAKYRSLVERLPNVTYTFSNPTMPYDASYGYVSPQVTDLLGCRPHEWLADEFAWRAFVHPDDVDEVDAKWRDAGERGEAFDIEYRMVARDGRIPWVREQSSAVIDDHGVALFWQGVITDITGQREAREALTTAFEQEREISRRFRVLDEMKNTFLAAVSHELRTPLSAILGLALTLEREELDLDPVESRELLRRLASNARKLNRLLSDLLDLDRLGRGIVEPRLRSTDVAALVRQVVENSDAIEVHRPHLDLDPVIADVDPAKVERIVENLLANAVRYTPIDAPIWVRLRPEGAGVLISVDDEGPGIPEELRAAVFEPFRQVPGRHEHAPGVGIGLSLVARFAELHGGRAWVEPREGGGSSFRVLLPGTVPAETPSVALAG